MYVKKVHTFNQVKIDHLINFGKENYKNYKNCQCFPNSKVDSDMMISQIFLQKNDKKN